MKTEKNTPGIISRRKILKLSPLVLLAGCDYTPEGKTESFLRSFQNVNDWIQARVFDPNRLAPEYPTDKMTPREEFRINDKNDDYPDVDEDNWVLEVDGLVARPGAYSLQTIQSLPKRTMNTRHCCVEGWSMIPRWGGTPLRDFLNYVGADMRAGYVQVECADDYSSPYDMPSALHPQTLLCYEAYDEPLTIPHGAPVRIVMPTKLGYKSAKWVTKLTVIDTKPGGYWEDRGYDWFAGL